MALLNYFRRHGAAEVPAQWHSPNGTYQKATIHASCGRLKVVGADKCAFEFSGLHDPRGAQILLPEQGIAVLRTAHDTWRADSRLVGVGPEKEVQEKQHEPLGGFTKRLKLFLKECRRDIFTELLVKLRLGENGKKETHFTFSTQYPVGGEQGLPLTMYTHNELMGLLDKPLTKISFDITPGTTLAPSATYDPFASAIIEITDAGHVFSPNVIQEPIGILWACASNQSTRAQHTQGWPEAKKEYPLDWDLPDGKLFMDLYIVSYASPFIEDNEVELPENPFFYLAVNIYVRNFLRPS